MVSWIEDARTTVITQEQLQDLGISSFGQDCSHIIAVSCCMRANIDDAAKENIAQLKTNLQELQRVYGEQRVWFTSNKAEVESKAQALFREINCEHKGHNIAQ